MGEVVSFAATKRQGAFDVAEQWVRWQLSWMIEERGHDTVADLLEVLREEVLRDKAKITGD